MSEGSDLCHDAKSLGRLGRMFKQKKRQNHNNRKRTYSEPPIGGIRNKDGNAGKIKITYCLNRVSGCIYCNHRIINSRQKSLYVKVSLKQDIKDI